MNEDDNTLEEEEISQDGGQQYFLFISGGDIYAMDALLVAEIVEYQSITKVPMMKSCVKGVTNVRGNIIAVVDLLDRFELGETKVSARTSLAIIKTIHLDKTINIAIIIDEVYEVDNISDIHMKVSPDFGTKINKKFIKFIGRYNNQDIAILNTDTILNIKELAK
ncbi:MAG: purine-binding chemotaxis protein CheW [Campylobacteraceae bacterium]|nr:purine-binding chemotaxis protein CheW [Campylobacteraceae bacterium]